MVKKKFDPFKSVMDVGTVSIGASAMTGLVGRLPSSPSSPRIQSGMGMMGMIPTTMGVASAFGSLGMLNDVAKKAQEKRGKNILKKLKNDNIGSAIPILYFIMTIVAAGALFSLLFIEIGFPTFLGYIPSSDSKTFLLMMLHGIPLIVLFVGVVCMVREGLKKGVY